MKTRIITIQRIKPDKKRRDEAQEKAFDKYMIECNAAIEQIQNILETSDRHLKIDENKIKRTTSKCVSKLVPRRYVCVCCQQLFSKGIIKILIKIQQFGKM